jgi:abortive infection bacteriophage resistance protein
MDILKDTNKALSISDQISLLQKRGVFIEDISFAHQVLEYVSFYRFKAYLVPFQKNDGTKNYIPSTSFFKAWQYYYFDAQLRLLMMEAIEQVEVAVKTKMVNYLSSKYGPLGYLNCSIFATPLNYEKYNKLLLNVYETISKSSDGTVKNLGKTHKTFDSFPIWIIFEFMTFGNMVTFFRLLTKHDKEVLAKYFGSNSVIFESYLANLNYIRNICAHNARLWNREIVVNPLIPKKDPKWHEKSFPVNERRVYSSLCILKLLLDIIALKSNWKNNFYLLLQEFPMIHRKSMGIPNGFENSSIWK